MPSNSRLTVVGLSYSIAPLLPRQGRSQDVSFHRGINLNHLAACIYFPIYAKEV